MAFALIMQFRRFSCKILRIISFPTLKRGFNDCFFYGKNHPTRIHANHMIDLNSTSVGGKARRWYPSQLYVRHYNEGRTYDHILLYLSYLTIGECQFIVFM